MSLDLVIYIISLIVLTIEARLVRTDSSHFEHGWIWLAVTAFIPILNTVLVAFSILIMFMGFLALTFPNIFVGVSEFKPLSRIIDFIYGSKKS